MRHPIEQPKYKQASITLPTQPHAIFGTLQGTQTPTQSQPYKKLKKSLHSPSNLADEYQAS